MIRNQMIGTDFRNCKSQSYSHFTPRVMHGKFLTFHLNGERSGLAADYLGDPTAWRRIAEANKIDDPLNLSPGLSLVVPGGSRR